MAADKSKNDSKFTGRGGGTVFTDSKIDFHLDSKGKQLLTGNADFRLQASVNTTASEGHDFLDSGFDPEFSFGITIRRIGAGLENLGNTCFLNSVLQCLTYTEPLAAYLQSGMHRISCRIAGFCALCAIQKHVSRALQSTGRILAPKDLVSNLRCISRNFRNARQEDAHEYMVHLLESMHKCCIPKGVPSESPSAYEKSLVHKIFGGRLQSQVKCMQCSYRSNTFDPFLDLSLEIAKVDSLHKALLNFTATEQLDGGEMQYQCQHCKQKVNATKQLTVYKAPYVLTVHLKRFCAHDPGRKIDKKVHFTPSLNLKPFVSGSYEGDLKYILYGVLVHAGYSTHSGHYYSFVRTASGIWYRVDDNRVVAVGERTVLEQKAYMLFYYRDRANAGPRKLVHARKTEKLAEVGLRNEMLSSSIQRVKSGVRDVSVTNLFSRAYTSAAAVKKDELNVSLMEDTRLEEKSCVHKQNQNAPTIAENKKKETDCSELSMAPSVEERRVSALSVINPGALNREREQLSPLVPPVLVSGEDVCVSNGCSNEPKEEENPSKTPHISATSYSNCTTLQKPATEVSTGMTLEKVEDVAIGSATFVFPDDKIAVDSCLKVSLNGLTESSSSPVLSNTPSHMIAADQKYFQKVKKRGLKFQLWCMHLGSNILYRASLKSMRKKKKTKLRRKRSLESNNLSKEEIDMKPSTSKETRASVHPRKKVRSCSDRHNPDTFVEASISLDGQLVGGDIRNGELKERLHQYGAVRATDKSTLKRPRSNCCLEVDTCEARDPGDLNYTNRKSMQNGLMNMVTRGLEETIVASWDGVDLPLSHGVHFDSRELVSVGYAPDELDEEYDRGKKKTRSTSNSSFDGKNSFQIIAGKKKQLKKPMVDGSSGNQPFRI